MELNKCLAGRTTETGFVEHVRIALIRMQMVQRPPRPGGWGVNLWIYVQMLQEIRRGPWRNCNPAQFEASWQQVFMLFQATCEWIAEASNTPRPNRSSPAVSSQCRILCRRLPLRDMQYRGEPQSRRWKIAFLIIALVGDVSCIRNNDAAHDEWVFMSCLP